VKPTWVFKEDVDQRSKLSGDDFLTDLAELSMQPGVDGNITIKSIADSYSKKEGYKRDPYDVTRGVEGQKGNPLETDDIIRSVDHEAVAGKGNRLTRFGDVLPADKFPVGGRDVLKLDLDKVNVMDAFGLNDPVFNGLTLDQKASELYSELVDQRVAFTGGGDIDFKFSKSIKKVDSLKNEKEKLNKEQVRLHTAW